MEEDAVAEEEATAEHILMVITIGKIAHSTRGTQTIHTQAAEVMEPAEVMEAVAMEAEAIIKVVAEATISTTIEEATITVIQMTVTTITKTTGTRETMVHKI